MDKILIKLFSDPESIYGLKEFSNINISEVIKIFEEEKGKISFKDVEPVVFVPLVSASKFPDAS